MCKMRKKKGRQHKPAFDLAGSAARARAPFQYLVATGPPQPKR
jgi:hypothetical protein